DGRADVAAAERVATPTQKCGSSKVNVRLTARIAAPPTSFPTSGCHTTLLPVDLDGDGADDLLRMSREGDLARSLSNRDGTFTSAPTAPGSGTAGTGAHAPAPCGAAGPDTTVPPSTARPNTVMPTGA